METTRFALRHYNSIGIPTCKLSKRGFIFPQHILHRKFRLMTEVPNYCSRTSEFKFLIQY